ncbi:putative FAD-linked oxidoreductase [Symmachiella dynata]|uniref:D-lactate dehydrogenase (cytochrome) n=1 Tax=Symmachiella dynata TaxID=2527995 RepID=A0A517ZNH1_9PLAN|nr:FAD-linked oxidase C-terminal domain-containing protein [Symmachiella dynata]QDU44008.1 putative FAD-linked oxidoreductase [Symmachiella dynata]
MTKFSQAQSELTALLGDRLTLADGVRDVHGSDESWQPAVAPEAVAFPETTAEVAEIVKICSARGVPMIPYGIGSAVEGGIVATRGGLCIDLSGMHEIRAIHPEDLDAVVDAGVTHVALNERLEGSQLFFSVDPGAAATIGGMAATRASGSNAFRYGTMRENVLGLEVVLADGRVIHTSRRARKSAAGYDLTRLFVGSEGTLGIITAVTVRLHRVPEALSSAVCPFPDVAAAVKTVIQTIQAGIPLARMELLDEAALQAVNAYSGLDYAPAPTLFLEFQGTEQGVVEQSQRVARIAAEQGGTDFQWATDAAQRNKLWQARHDAYYAIIESRPGSRSVTTDVCVPISRLAECIAETRRDLQECSLPCPMLGHVGDGNFHVLFLVDPNRLEELAEAEHFNSRMVQRALDMEGTCSGEHGIGLGKREFLQQEHGAAWDVMRSIKATLDPQNVMNPGKVFAD